MATRKVLTGAVDGDNHDRTLPADRLRSGHVRKEAGNIPSGGIAESIAHTFSGEGVHHAHEAGVSSRFLSVP